MILADASPLSLLNKHYEDASLPTIGQARKNMIMEDHWDTIGKALKDLMVEVKDQIKREEERKAKKTDIMNMPTPKIYAAQPQKPDSMMTPEQYAKAAAAAGIPVPTEGGNVADGYNMEIPTE